MIWKSLKYLAIVFAHMILLFVLLNFWVDDFEVLFNEFVFLDEALNLLGLFLLNLVALGFAAFLFRRLNITTLRHKIGIAILITFIVNAYKYTDYVKKVYEHQFINKELRDGIASKVKPPDSGWYGNNAEQLTNREYCEIAKNTKFPELPKEADNISYLYEYEGFLPDYTFHMEYDLPLNQKVDTMKYKSGTFSKTRSFKVVGEKKRVTYSESYW